MEEKLMNDCLRFLNHVDINGKFHRFKKEEYLKNFDDTRNIFRYHDSSLTEIRFTFEIEKAII